jgi:CTP synthase (UTP-ammonia lyase)
MREERTHMQRGLTVGVIGDFDPSSVPHVSTNAALDHASAALGIPVAVSWLPTLSLADRQAAGLDSFDGLWCSPGSPYRSMEGALEGIRFAREKRWPFFAT